MSSLYLWRRSLDLCIKDPPTLTSSLVSKALEWSLLKNIVILTKFPIEQVNVSIGTWIFRQKFRPIEDIGIWLVRKPFQQTITIRQRIFRWKNSVDCRRDHIGRRNFKILEFEKIHQNFRQNSVKICRKSSESVENP